MVDFDNTYARQLPGFYAPWRPRPVPDPALVALNVDLADELGVDADDLRDEAGVAWLAGAAVPDGAQPIALAYAGHQFGSFSPLLGDGRAVLLGEVIDRQGRRRDLALKGSGRTPFSRGGDGQAVLGPVLREFLVGEAMHALGVPTTRALAAVTTGQTVPRQRPEPGAVLTRVASSHLRVGTFELVHSRGTPEQMRLLADYAVHRHYPHLAETPAPQRYLALLKGVVAAQADLIAAWMAIGFVHGVMNTDNMTISGETIDYGPCAFLDAYDPDAVFSSIDSGGRYRFGHQPAIAVWNLSRFAEALLPLLSQGSPPENGQPDAQVEAATAAVEQFGPRFATSWLERMRTKLGLTGPTEADDATLVGSWLELMAQGRLPYTTAWRDLSASLVAGPGPAFGSTELTQRFSVWRQTWLARLGDQELARVAAQMDTVNPVHIPANHLVEAALDAARTGDLGPFEDLLEAVRNPFTPTSARFTAPSPPGFTAGYVTYCGT